MKLFRRTDRSSQKDSVSDADSAEKASARQSVSKENSARGNPLDRFDTVQRAALLEQTETPQTPDVSLYGLTRFASTYDRVLQVIGLIFCMAAGAALVSGLSFIWNQPHSLYSL